MKKHADLSASGAHRWMSCPGSVALTAHLLETGQARNEVSSFATEGTEAHRLAERCLGKLIDLRPYLKQEDFPDGMLEYVSDFVDFVNNLVREKKGSLEIEQRVDFSKWVPEGWGTADAIITSEEEITVVDLKYGKGVQVEAGYNPQLRLYMLGAWNRLSPEHREKIKTVTGVIVQPRIDHISEETITIEELLKFGSEAIILSTIALSDNAPLVASEKGCRFCVAKGICKTRAEANLNLAKEDFNGNFPTTELLSKTEIANILDRANEITRWVDDVEAYALDLAKRGEEIPGYKLVEGRSIRRWTKEAISVLKEHEMADQLLITKPVGITQAEKILGKKSELLHQMTFKPRGKTKLTKESDKRNKISPYSSVIDDFKGD